MDETPLQNGAALVIAVDLTPMRPGGANGGIKPAIFAMLAEAQRLGRDSLCFIFLTHASTHAEARELARPLDLLICVLQDGECALDARKLDGSREFLMADPPPGLVKRIGADLLYAPFGACTFQAEGIPSIALIADLLHRDYPHTLTSPQIAEREAYIAHTLQSATMIQSISRSGVERLQLHYRLPEEKSFYTYLPVQVRAEEGGSEESLAGLGIREPYFFYPANLWKHKNHETLLLAYRLYRRQAGDAAWDLVLTFHEDARGAEIRELARHLGIERHLHCPGYVSEAGLREIWSHAGALVFPSLHEGFGIPLLEAMHYRVPIVSAPDFSLREIAGDAACFIDPRKPESIAAALLKVSGDDALRESLRCRGRQRLDFFDLSIETRKLMDAWRRCASGRAGFPRRPVALESEALVAVPTQASNALWTVEVRVNPRSPRNRYRCYLDDASFGSFTCGPQEGFTFRFNCRPSSRVLRIIPFNPIKSSLAVVDSIVAINPSGASVPLFQKLERSMQ